MFFRQIEVGAHAIFAYLIGDLESGQALVVDPADDVDLLIAIAAESGLEIQSIVNTHAHVDHVMGNAEMQEKTGAEIVIHQAEADYLVKIGDFWLQTFNARRSPPADRTLSDGDRIQVGNDSWEVRHTPGHTPGGVCLYHADSAVCLTGDTLFVGSVGRTDGPRSSGRTMLQSIEEQILTLPDETHIYPGHNYGPTPTSTVAHERQHNPFLNGLDPDLF